MELYLIRHTTPLIDKGICYGQSDLDVTDSFHQEAEAIRQVVGTEPITVFASPLKRCRCLAEHLFPDTRIQFDDRLKEINCGEWEMRPWDSINDPRLPNWMKDSINVSIPGGESYQQVFERVSSFISELKVPQAAIVTHGGVIRSMLSYFSKLPLKESFSSFAIRYGAVYKVLRQGSDWVTEELHNPPSEPETHRPTNLVQTRA